MNAHVDILNFWFGKTIEAVITRMKQRMSTRFVTIGRIKNTRCLARIRCFSTKFGNEFIVLTAASGATVIVNISHGKHLDAYYYTRLNLVNNTS